MTAPKTPEAKAEAKRESLQKLQAEIDELKAEEEAAANATTQTVELAQLDAEEERLKSELAFQRRLKEARDANKDQQVALVTSPTPTEVAAPVAPEDNSGKGK